MSNLIVNQCEYGCGVVGIYDLEEQKQVGEELEEHYKYCKLKEKKMNEKICECGHLAVLHSDGEYMCCGECFDIEAVNGNCKCKEYKERQEKTE